MRQEPAKRFAIFESVISIIESATGLKSSIGEARAAIGYAEALENAEGFAQAIVEKQDKNKTQLKKARQKKKPVSLKIDELVNHHGFESFRRAPESQRAPHNVAVNILPWVNRDLVGFGLPPMKTDAVRKRVEKLRGDWISAKPSDEYQKAGQPSD